MIIEYSPDAGGSGDAAQGNEGISLEEARAITGLDRPWCAALVEGHVWPIIQHHPERLSRRAVEEWAWPRTGVYGRIARGELSGDLSVDAAFIAHHRRLRVESGQGKPHLTEAGVVVVDEEVGPVNYGDFPQAIAHSVDAGLGEWLYDAIFAGYLPMPDSVSTLLKAFSVYARGNPHLPTNPNVIRTWAAWFRDLADEAKEYAEALEQLT